jgi:hypothetical protein
LPELPDARLDTRKLMRVLSVSAGSAFPGMLGERRGDRDDDVKLRRARQQESRRLVSTRTDRG